MPFQFPDVQSMAGPYLIPIMVVVGIAVAVWVVLVVRALQVHNDSLAAKLDRYVKERQSEVA
ncbi:MAG TPA: hypothetical protein VF221_08290 [Chloroflexota bacterium]